MQNLKQENSNLLERIIWLIRLRWIAAAGVVCTLLFIKYSLHFSFPYHFLYAVVFLLIFYNIILYFLCGRLRQKYPEHVFAPVFTNVQISFDLLCLALLIHFSGGVENPFIFYFIFHMIIASILLSRRASFLQATYAIFLFLAMIISEYSGILPHYCLDMLFTGTAHTNPLYLFGVSFAFISTLYFAVYMATSISIKLWEKEGYLEEANKMLEEKDRIKSEYVLRVTHDIKESLAAVQSCVEPVAEKILGPLNSKQDTLLTTAITRTKRLIFFVNALLEITKIKLTQKVKMQYFDLQDVVKTVSQDIIGRAQSKGITFKVNVSPAVVKIYGIRLYIEEAILNLLANSVKYSSRGGTISLDIEEKNNTICIYVRDNGVGIPKEDLPHIFEEFYRAKNVRKIEREGTGLGLAIAKKIVEMHGGKIWLESEEHKGTEIFIELPKKHG